MEINTWMKEQDLKISNKNFQKIRKSNILFYLYGGYIYINKMAKNEYISFFEKEDKLYWDITPNGATLTDDNVSINFDNFNILIKDFVKDCYETLSRTNDEIFINEIKKTSLWKENINKTIKKEKIIKYFEDNKPFFISIK